MPISPDCVFYLLGPVGFHLDDIHGLVPDNHQSIGAKIYKRHSPLLDDTGPVGLFPDKDQLELGPYDSHGNSVVGTDHYASQVGSAARLGESEELEHEHGSEGDGQQLKMCLVLKESLLNPYSRDLVELVQHNTFYIRI